MTTQDPFTIDENATVIVEFSSRTGGFGEVSSSPEALAQKSAEALNKAMGTIYHMARRVNATIKQLADPPAEVEVDFGIKFSSEAGAVIARAGVDCSINVKLTWERKQQKTEAIEEKQSHSAESANNER